MIRFLAFVFALAAAAPAAPHAETPSEPVQGVLLLAHGGRAEWNAAVLDLVRELNADWPAEAAFGMATRRNIQEAIDRLHARGVSSIVAVPLFVSSHSSVIRSTEYLLGLRDDAPAALAAFARMDHGAHGGEGTTATTGTSHTAGNMNHAADPTSPVVSRAPIRMTDALDRHPLVAAMLVDRARAVSRDPAREVVVLVAHGPVPDDDNARWLADMEALAGLMRARTAYKRIEFQTVRDDAPAPVRAAAAAELRNRVEQITMSGDRALIVPLLLAYGGIEEGIRTRLDGLEYVMAPQGLLPDARIAEWVREVVRGARR